MRGLHAHRVQPPQQLQLLLRYAQVHQLLPLTPPGARSRAGPTRFPLQDVPPDHRSPVPIGAATRSLTLPARQALRYS